MPDWWPAIWAVLIVGALSFVNALVSRLPVRSALLCGLASGALTAGFIWLRTL